ncbi:MAG: hypothetical protein LQ349_008441 [Xanthoria aureola]|nr:MAG: hypothetical protein LQ349_008441 [Xanthoria aureola]
MAHKITTLKAGFEAFKTVLDERTFSIPEYVQLAECIYQAETKLDNYLETSSQKLLLAPEFSTIRMMESFGAKNLQRLRAKGIKDGLASKEDWEIVKKQEKLFEEQVAVSVEILDSLIWMREVYLLIITSLQTYTFPNRDISRPDQLDETDKLKAHREAMRNQSVLLSRQCAKASRLPAEMREAGRGFLELTEGLLGKARVWEKELVWGEVALQVAKESSVMVVLP